MIVPGAGELVDGAGAIRDAAEAATAYRLSGEDPEPGLERGVPVAVTYIVAQELLHGVATPEAFERLERYLGSQRRVELSDPWLGAVEAARIFGVCRAAGVTVRSSVDCLIARIAIEHDLALLHDGGGFEEIVRVVSELRLA